MKNEKRSRRKNKEPVSVSVALRVGYLAFWLFVAFPGGMFALALLLCWMGFGDYGDVTGFAGSVIAALSAGDSTLIGASDLLVGRMTIGYWLSVGLAVPFLLLREFFDPRQSLS